jgi:hypothetical protein
VSLTNPLALLWLAVAIPIVIFYILKIRLRRVPVSSILFWQQIFQEKQPRSIWQHLRHLLSLLVQLALLGLLVFALAQPFFKWETTQAQKLVLVVDNSASMRSTDVAPSRFEQALAVARRYVDRLAPRDEMAVVVAGTQPRVVCGLAAHKRTLRQAVESLTASDGPTRVAEAVELGRRLIPAGENGRVIVITDGAFPDAVKLTEAKDVELVAVGGRAANVGITRFQVRRSLLDPIGYEILAEVQNASSEETCCRLELDLGDDVVDVVPLTLKPEEVWTHVFEKTSAEGGLLRARLDYDDALAGDNQAWALLPRRELLDVTLVTAGNLFLEKVFEATPLVKLTVAKKPPGKPAAGGITVLHRQVPDRLPDGLVWAIDPAGSCDRWQVGETLENPIVTKQDKDSPLMAHVRLDNVIMPEARKLTFSQPPQVLVGAVAGEPLYAYWDAGRPHPGPLPMGEGVQASRPGSLPEGEEVVPPPDTLSQGSGGSKVLVLTVNLDQGDLPLRTAFPIMATNALAWFAGHRGELRESLASGAITEVELTGDRTSKAESTLAENNVLVAPGGERRALPAGLAKTTVGPLDKCGVWKIVPAVDGNDPSVEKPLLELACNLANRQESDVRTPEALLEKQTPTTVTAGLLVRPVWFYLVVLAWFLSGLEWYLYQRRWIS